MRTPRIDGNSKANEGLSGFARHCGASSVHDEVSRTHARIATSQVGKHGGQLRLAVGIGRGLLDVKADAMRLPAFDLERHEQQVDLRDMLDELHLLAVTAARATEDLHVWIAVADLRNRDRLLAAEASEAQSDS